MIGFDPFTLYVVSIVAALAMTMISIALCNFFFGKGKNIPRSNGAEVVLDSKETHEVLNPVITPEITPNVTYVATACPGDHLVNPQDLEHIKNAKIHNLSSEVDIEDKWSAMVKKAKEKSAALALEA